MSEINNKKSLEADYKLLLPQFETFEHIRQWSKEGDMIHEFTMYEDYPPAYSSSNTILNN